MTKKIPKPNRDGSLLSRLFPIIIAGFDNVFPDQESKLYIRLLVRLIDKANNEYENARHMIEEEIKSGDKLVNRFNIINHLENCINALNRAMKIINCIILSNGVGLNTFINDKNLIKVIKKYSTSSLRNRIEHIDEDIYNKKFKSNLFLDVNDAYSEISINKKSMKISELVIILEYYHLFVLHIFSNMPNKKIGDKYFYDK
jgi:hypothetical protein